MAGAIVVDRRTFNRGIDAMMKEYGTSAAGVMRRQMSILSGQLAKRYPPNKKSVGKQAIENDMKRIMIPMPQEHEDTLTRWQDSMESTFDVFDDTGTRIQQWHRDHIDPRKNRVTKSIRGTRFINGRKFSMKLHVKESDLKKYVNRLAGKVGTLKSGWVPGVTRWKGGKKPPSWVTKHSGNGYAVDRMRNDGSGYLEIGNRIQGAARWKRIDSFVVKSRESGFQKELKAAVRKADKAGNRIR
jgi:hypothetical protein